MKYRATGRDQLSGQPIEIVLEAADIQAAFASAQARSMIVDSINPVSASPAVPPPIPRYSSKPAPARVDSPKRTGIGIWTIVLVVIAFIVAKIEPKIGFIVSGFLLLLIVLYALPGMRGLARKALGLSVGQPFATSIKIIFVGLLAVVLFVVSTESHRAKSMLQRVEADRAKASNEKQRLSDDGNAKVDKLMVIVKEQMVANDIVAAIKTLDEMREIPHASNKGEGVRLHNSIILSRDSVAVRERMIGLSDEEFITFASGGKPPKVFDLGYPELNAAVLNLARSMLTEVKSERAVIAKKRSEEAEKRRKEELAAAEKRRKEELAQAEAERKERERTAAAEAAEKAVVQKELNDRSKAYITLLNSDEFAAKIVDTVAVERSGDRWTATITVKNLWHVRNKQLRLQDAQNLWEVWAVLTSRRNPDSARIKLVDLNGNEVGGSRAFAGSMIWVQD